MPNIYFPHINIALNGFALIVMLVIFVACLHELSAKNRRAQYFLLLLSSVVVALVADAIAWVGEGRPSLANMLIVFNTIASCAGQFGIIFFMGYLKETLYEGSRAAAFIVKLFFVLCVLSIAFSIGNAFYGYAAIVNAEGHWCHTESLTMGFLYLLFPIFSFFAIVMMALFAHTSTRVNRTMFLLYTLFPIAGIILDYTVHGLSLTYIGLAISILIIYTGIYIKKQRLIEAQKSALMLSQINPHFIYNTLSTIASMCEIAPHQAKQLTIDFAKYLRQNLSTLSKEELIPFSQELQHVECYLKIEKARFRERLNVIYSTQCIDFQIPPLTVQPLVENAIKHGITKKMGGGTIKIVTYDTDTHYVIEIIDDGVGFDMETVEKHVGLENVRSRMMAMCRGNLLIKSTVGVGTRVTLELPKGKKQKKRGANR